MASTATERFMWAVQALAQPAEVQLGLYPAFVVVADELVLDHEQAEAAFLDLGVALTPHQQRALGLLDRKIEQKSGSGSFWTEAALRVDPGWNQIRDLAADTLRQMGWPLEVPPKDPQARGLLYVGGSVVKEPAADPTDPTRPVCDLSGPAEHAWAPHLLGGKGNRGT